MSNFTPADDNKLLLAHWYAQTYKFDQFVDLKDLCIQIQKQFGPGKHLTCARPLLLRSKLASSARVAVGLRTNTPTDCPSISPGPSCRRTTGTFNSLR